MSGAGQGISLQRPSAYGINGNMPVAFLDVSAPSLSLFRAGTAMCLHDPLLCSCRPVMVIYGHSRYLLDWVKRDTHEVLPRTPDSLCYLFHACTWHSETVLGCFDNR